MSEQQTIERPPQKSFVHPVMTVTKSLPMDQTIPVSIPWLFSLQFKRSMDFVVSLGLLILLSPILVLVSLLVMMESSGSPLYFQWRKGTGQKPFRMLKFRTMVKDAHKSRASLVQMNEVDGIIFKIKEDPRITRIGRILRKYSIDELPQLVNILRGEMSLVGPRPFPLEDFENSNYLHPLYDAWMEKRHSVTPGLTGLWQVSGRNNLPFEDLMKLDLRYVNHWSLPLDFQILFKTIAVVITHYGAY